MNQNNYIPKYLKKSFSLIPLKNNTKEPCIKWKQYQNKKASFEEILNWFITFDKPNIALITGKKLVVIDIDNIEKLPELFKRLPEAQKTTRVKTKRGFHFYFSNDGHKVRSTKNLFNLGIELKAKGSYVVACPSVVNDFTYTFEIPLSKMLPFPTRILNVLEKREGQAPDVVENNQAIKYRTRGVACIGQIIERDLQEGEREISLFILYNLLLQNKNALDYSQKVVKDKNASLTEPLTNEEVDKTFRKVYTYGCSRIIDTLPFINCDGCKYKFRGGKLKMGNIIIKNQRRLRELSGAEAKVLMSLGTYFDGEKPLQSEIIRVSGISKNTVRGAMKGLKEKGILE